MLSAYSSDTVSTKGGRAAELRLLCPVCRKSETALGNVTAGGWSCPTCGFGFARQDGIIRGLAPERAKHYTKFIEEYLTIRRAEGRGSEDSDFYLALPYQDLSGKLFSQWAIRSKSYRYFEKKILQPLEEESPGGLDVLDLGAGNGWLSYRLALRRHRPAAVDLLIDEFDGLGARRHYASHLEREFPAFQAEFDNLPFADAQFDLAIFNASFHYSTDYRETLQEVRRCLRWPGRLVIIDSPVYKRAEDGERMREEKHQQFETGYGFRSDSIRSIEYLDQRMLRELSRHLNIHWTVYRPWYGWAWHLRPLKAWLKRRRTPSRFWILVGRWSDSAG